MLRARTACLDPACRGIRPSLRGPIPKSCLRRAFSCSRVLIRKSFLRRPSLFFRRRSLLARGGSGDLPTGIKAPCLPKNIRRPDLRWPSFGMAGPPVLARQTGRKRSTRPTYSISYPLPFEMTSDQPSLLVLPPAWAQRYGGLKQLDPVGPSTRNPDGLFHLRCQAGRFQVVFLIRREMRDLFEEQVGRKYQGILEVDYAYQDKDDLPVTCLSCRA